MFWAESGSATSHSRKIAPTLPKKTWRYDTRAKAKTYLQQFGVESTLPLIGLAVRVFHSLSYLDADSVLGAGLALPPVTKSGSESAGITKSKNANSISSQD
jgi:hypothetical protein